MTTGFDNTGTLRQPGNPGKQVVLANNKTSAKLSWKRREALSIAQSIHQYFEDRGFPLPASHRTIFGRKFKATESVKAQTRVLVMQDLKEAGQEKPSAAEMLVLKKQKLQQLRAAGEREKISVATRYFTDQETGECQHEELIELARAYYTLRNSSPAVYALFKHKTNNHYLKQLVALACSSHRLDPVWNYKKSKLIRGLWFRYLQETKIHEQYQPMHLMLTVPHKNGEWKGKRFYAREFIERFNKLRKFPGWKRCIYGGEYGIEVTRKGNSGLHIHMHCLVFQHKHPSKKFGRIGQRDLVNRYVRMMWRRLTGAEITWYETLYVHRKDESGKFMMEETAEGVPFLDKSGSYEDESGNAHVIDSQLIRGKRKKFYLDDSDPWFGALPAEEKLKHYCDGVLECIKYHFKTDCFKGKAGTWDVELMREVLQHSRYLRMYSKFGAFYREAKLNYSRIEKAVIPEDLTVLAAEGIAPCEDGVENRVTNPYNGRPAIKGDYKRVLSLPEIALHARDKKGNIRAPVNHTMQEIFYAVRDDVDIGKVISGIMQNKLEHILEEEDLRRLREHGWRAPRQTMLT